MKKLLIAFLSAAVTGLVTAAETNATVAEKMTAEEKAAADAKAAAAHRASIYRHFGGKIKKPGIQKGKVVYVNCQKVVPAAVIRRHCGYVDQTVQVAAELEEGEFDIRNPQRRGEASIFIIDDPTLPISLVAPESMWCAVNVARLKSEKPQFTEARLLKELSRTFLVLAGGISSMFPLAITRPVTAVEGLDEFADPTMPMDVIERCRGYLPACGIVPYKLVNYRKACKEGWAPNPTNDVQKKIWDDVRALPEKPLKIKYDPKRDAGK